MQHLKFFSQHSWNRDKIGFRKRHTHLLWISGLEGSQVTQVTSVRLQHFWWYRKEQIGKYPDSCVTFFTWWKQFTRGRIYLTLKIRGLSLRAWAETPSRGHLQCSSLHSGQDAVSGCCHSAGLPLCPLFSPGSPIYGITSPHDQHLR